MQAFTNAQSLSAKASNPVLRIIFITGSLWLIRACAGDVYPVCVSGHAAFLHVYVFF